MRAPVVLLVLCLTLAAAHSGHVGAKTLRCDDVTYLVEEQDSLLEILTGFGANSTWVQVCLDSGLLDLESCMFPSVGTELFIGCHTNASDVVLSDFAALLNFSSVDEFGFGLAEVLTAYLGQGVLTVDEAVSVQDWMVDFAAAAFPMPYDMRSAGSCGVNLLGLNLPSSLVGPNIDKCCSDHDTNYDACSGFDAANSAFDACLGNACAAIMPSCKKWQFWVPGCTTAWLKYGACSAFRSTASAAVSSNLGKVVYCCVNTLVVNNVVDPLRCVPNGSPCPAVTSQDSCLGFFEQAILG